jgi:hypothetical protein
MLYDVPKPKISNAFTVEDIRKIRDWHYDVLKDATREERREFYSKGATRFYESRQLPKIVRPGEKNNP